MIRSSGGRCATSASRPFAMSHAATPPSKTSCAEPRPSPEHTDHGDDRHGRSAPSCMMPTSGAPAGSGSWFTSRNRLTSARLGSAEPAAIAAQARTHEAERETQHVARVTPRGRANRRR